MLIRRPSDIRSSEITDKKLYMDRRGFMQLAAAAGVGVLAGDRLSAAPAVPAPHGQKLTGIAKSPLSLTTEKPASWSALTTFNNYYEFGTDKDNPADRAGSLKIDPWSIVVDGECNKKATYAIEDLLKGQTLEERIYRHRCVEGWSMIIPWAGFPLANLVKRFEPTSKAKYIKFTTLNDSKQMPGVRSTVLRWPYVEGLRLDEAMHPLTIMAVGLYDEVLPRQNGAPIRLVVPWKYGFKGAKAIVKISFVEKQPLTSWMESVPDWYGFYSNVNPAVSPVRWDQGTEQRIGEFVRRRTTLFNGYQDQVAGLYAGMDLRKNY
jgi:sulfoxide reductase catalytic subunit YedY